jgi:hypothetical protein
MQLIARLTIHATPDVDIRFDEQVDLARRQLEAFRVQFADCSNSIERKLKPEPHIAEQSVHDDCDALLRHCCTSWIRGLCQDRLPHKRSASARPAPLPTIADAFTSFDECSHSRSVCLSTHISAWPSCVESANVKPHPSVTA